MDTGRTAGSGKRLMWGQEDRVPGAHGDGAVEPMIMAKFLMGRVQSAGSYFPTKQESRRISDLDGVEDLDNTIWMGDSENFVSPYHPLHVGAPLPPDEEARNEALLSEVRCLRSVPCVRVLMRPS